MKKGTRIISGFDVRSKSPIDSRIVKETYDDMVNDELNYEGIIVSCLETQKVYVMFNGQFEPIGSVGSEAFTYVMPFSLARDTKTENDYLIRK